MASRSERVILEPVEVAEEGRKEIDLHKDNIRIGPAGPDWGDYEIESFKAKRQIGEVPIDFEMPNRIIAIPLLLGGTGDFDAARISLQAEASLINERGGGRLKREIIGGTYGEAGGHLFADLVKATLKLGDGTPQATDGVDANAELILEALPDFYGNEITGEAHEGTGDLSWTEKVKGNLPGRVTSLTVTDKSGIDQLGLGWHFRCKNYSAASTANWAYEAEALTPLDTAAEVELTGASGGKAILHNNLSTGWTPVLSTNLKAGTFLTHKGLYDVWARVYSTSEVLLYLRLLWDVGDIVAPSENRQVSIPTRNNFHLVNLGQVNLRPSPIGTHRWQGTLQARGEAGGENIYIDRLQFICADEASGIVTGKSGALNPVSGKYLVRDEFNQTAGAATGKTAAIGGVYAVLPNSDTDDFEIDATTHRLKRATVSDTGKLGAGEVVAGRGIGTPVEATNLAFRTDFVLESAAGFQAFQFGHIISYVNNTNFVTVYFDFVSSLQYWTIRVTKASAVTGNLGDNHRIRGMTTSSRAAATLLTVVRGNTLTVYAGGEGEELREELTVADAMIGPKGKAYIYDVNIGGNAGTRYFDNAALWTPENDAVVYANRNARLTSQGMFRQSEDGVAYGPVAYPGSDLPRLPVAGPEELPVEIALKPSRGDFDNVPDAGLDKISAQLSYRPCWSEIPSS